MEPNQPLALKKPKMVLAGLVGVVLLCSVFLLGYTLGAKQAANQKEAGFNAGLQEASRRLQASGLIPPTMTILNISGTVTAVGSDYMEVDAAPTTTINPLADSTPTKRHVTISAETKLMRAEPKSQAAIEADMTAFAKAQAAVDAAMKAGERPESPTPPSLLILTDIKLSDVKIGDSVSITAATDISDAAAFTATEITVQSAPAAAAQPTPAAGTPLPTPPAAPTMPSSPPTQP